MMMLPSKWFCQGCLITSVLSVSACYHSPERPSLGARFPQPSLNITETSPTWNPLEPPPVPATIIKDSPSSPTALQPGPLVEISPSDVLISTVANNLDIRIEELTRQNAEDDVEAELGIYDLEANLSASYSRSASGNRSQSSSTTKTTTPGAPPTLTKSSRTSSSSSLSNSRRSAIDAFLSQLLPSGGVVTLGYMFERSTSAGSSESRSPGDGGGSSSTDSDSRSQSVQRGPYIGIVQPLLRGFGAAVTNAGIRIANINKQISDEAFRAQVMTQLANALKAYWDLVFAFNNYDVQKLSLAQARDLLRINKVKYEAGSFARVEVLQAEAEVASREEQIIVAEQTIQDNMDTLKLAMNLPKTSHAWSAQLIPQTKPSYFEVHYNEEEAIAEALQMRPDVRQTRMAQDINETNRVVADNARLPQLDLSGQLTYIQPDKSQDYDFDQYSAALAFSYPLQNRQARANYRKALTDLEKGRLAIEQIEQAASMEVRTTLRQVATMRKQIDVTTTSVEFETAKLEAEQARLGVGVSTSFQVIQFQQDFAQAQVNFLQAVVDYNKALIDLENAKGTLLDRMGIQIADRGLGLAQHPAGDPATE